MPSNGGAELRAALEAVQHARKRNNAHSAETALERALLSASAGALDTEKETVAAAVRLLRTADDNGTTRLEVRDQAMTRRRWFEVNASGEAKWGNR
jgi:K+-transporting ATPase c subunit